MKRHATAHWSGNLADGKGSLTTQSGALSDHAYSFKARFEDESGTSGTNPEELLAAAHAGCFTMQLSHLLAENGTPATDLDTKCIVSVVPKEGGGFEITRSALTLTAVVEGIEQDDFDAIAEKAKNGCPMSVALGAIDITLGTQLQ
ncbi:MAG: OsmC family protein [Hyphomonas sp.]|uniref:OsmC family protein n=1 Tax=unclassified Hyphomonas TaxID=2630699 RepID=UPI001A8E4D1E|nr:MULTISPECIES: OsmC family protein [unclassified Hyphomonas]MBO6583084.1 OsmC family protein [Hyphomonas sp.]QSR21327.1 OsmC family peroxiredoxin [Hyphomonas sp. KY3]